MAQRADELAAKRLAADDHDQDSEDTKEEGEIGDEKQEAEGKDGEVKGQAGSTLTTTESGGGGDACSFSPPPVDRNHHSPGNGKRRMSDEEQQEDAKQPKTPSMKDFMDGFLERQGDRMAAQAADQERHWERQTQQLNQMWAAFRQSQAAGHGEGGLGLAKGDG